MKKIVIGLIGVLACVLFAGCGVKSEPQTADMGQTVDIEQFRCQDSIQTVFDVLGKTALVSNNSGVSYYRYENLNLWGYEGEAIFFVRDDKDTIKMFICYLTLTEEEIEELYSYFSEKYGSYVEQEYINGDKADKWYLEKEKAEEAGYDDIRIQCSENEKYTVYFEDKWSESEDETYYKYLKEQEGSESEETKSKESEIGEYESEEYEFEIVADETYSIGDDTFHFTISGGDANYHLSLFCKIEEKIDAFYTNIALNALMTSEDQNIAAIVNGFDFSYTIVLGDGSMLTRTKGALMVLSEENELIGIEELFPIEALLKDEDIDSDYGDQVLGFFGEFLGLE